VIDRCAGKRLILVTCHRRESFAAAPEIAAAIRALANRPDVMIALPLHPNPAIRRPLEKALRGQANVELLEPLGFAPFVSLLAAAHFALTDSGGVQEEAPVLGTPVLVMRDVTERPEGVAAGTARLVGTRAQRIVSEACLLLDNPAAHARMARVHSPYGDSRAAERIADIIARAHGYGAEALASAE
jgi:UDP-N-acetylglucosamine 2-epimerase (non-hydrolysing)